MGKLGFDVYHGNETYKVIYEKLGEKFLFNFMVLIKSIEEEYGKSQIINEFYNDEESGEKGIDIGFISGNGIGFLNMNMDKDGNITVKEK